MGRRSGCRCRQDACLWSGMMLVDLRPAPVTVVGAVVGDIKDDQRTEDKFKAGMMSLNVALSSLNTEAPKMERKATEGLKAQTRLSDSGGGVQFRLPGQTRCWSDSRQRPKEDSRTPP